MKSFFAFWNHVGRYILSFRICFDWVGVGFMDRVGFVAVLDRGLDGRLLVNCVVI
jgi:hypothetical protein